MIKTIVKDDYIIEEKSITFQGGWSLVGFKTGYVLTAIYPIERPNTEAASYGYNVIYGRTDGYFILNRNASVSAGIKSRLIWLKVRS